MRLSLLGLSMLLVQASCLTCLLPERVSAQETSLQLPPQALYLSGPARRVRRQIPDDPVLSALLGGTEPFAVSAGDEVSWNEDSVTWQPITVSENGHLQEDLRPRGYVYLTFDVEEDRVLVLNAAGFSRVFLNGQPRASDVYGHGYAHLPVRLRKGKNYFLGQVGRGRPRIKFYVPPANVFAVSADQTLPDIETDQAVDTWGAVILVNATNQPQSGLDLVCTSDRLHTTRTPIRTIPPCSIRKAPFQIRGTVVDASQAPDEVALALHIESGQRRISKLDTALRIKSHDQSRRRTFVSKLDGSVQYYGIRTALPNSEHDPLPAIVLSCHGASVTGIRQSDAYSPKTWLHLVAPTNRRPFGFDWEDFGRSDAMEVLSIARETLTHDPSRIYLTGHSMGGHGTWHIGTTFPDQFAAIGPSAGWISYHRYVGGQPDEDTAPIEAILQRGRLAGDALGLATNLKQVGVYILHGGADDNVPASQAQRMAEELETFHHDWAYHEEPGKGHWWSNDLDDGGATCMDWPDMYDLFARHAIPPTQAVRKIDFATANPGVSSNCHWAQIYRQQKHHLYSRIQLRCWPNKGQFEGSTENVKVLRLRTSHLRSPKPLTIRIDGNVLENVELRESGADVWLTRDTDSWRVSQEPPKSEKGAHRYGAIKNEVKNDFVIVYGTSGNAAENATTFAKARLDAETFWYRGNATPHIVADVDFRPDHRVDSSVVLYGNADTNTAWSTLLADSPVQVNRGQITVGDESWQGNDMFAMFLQPRPGSDVASVIAVAASGQIGGQWSYGTSFFVPFVRFPDCVVLKQPSSNQTRPLPLAAGYFADDWSLEQAEMIIRK